MSEEAVRQTRSQKRALERDVLPLSTELASSENDTKRPKLDQVETRPEDFQPDQIQAVPTPDLEPGQDVQNRTGTGAESEKEPDSEPGQLTLPLALPSAHKPSNEEQGRIQKQPEPGPDHRTDPNVGRVKKEAQAEIDTRSRVPSLEPKVSSSLLAAGEVKATIKVEVQTGEQPVDMSTSRSSVKGEKRPPSPDEEEDDDDDVIILSDNDSPSPPMNGLSHLSEIDTELLMKSSPQERDRIIKQLKQELRLEEAKLVLLKKLRQSQIQKDALQKPSGLSGSAAPPPLIRGTLTGNKGSQQVVSGRSSGTVIPPPLVRGGQQLSSKHGSQVIMPPLVRGAQPISVSPQQIQALRQQQQQQLAASGGSGPPPLLLAPRNSLSGAQGQRGLLQSGLIRMGNNASLLVNISQASPTNQKGSSLTTQSGNSGVSVVNVTDSPASRQAAAKLALRKQLEKTLLEIPPPKPPTPEFNFHPSAANNEFIYLVGLEEVVQNLLSSIGRGKTGLSLSKPALTEPFSCTQCTTDFTCRWRHDKAKGGTILCEDCMSSNQKKAFKAEHTNRLKAAFVKALQQEQEIEQRILKQASSSPVSHTTSSSSSSSVSSASLKVEQLVSQQLKQAQARASAMQHHHQHSRGQNIIRHHSTSIKQSSQGQLSRGGVLSGGTRAVPHSFSSSSQLQSAVAAAALVNRPGKHAHVSRPAAQNLKVSSGKTSSTTSSSSTTTSRGGNPQATAWKKQSSNTTGVTMAYVNPSLSGHNKTSTTVDARQREYLLDMIPSRSISQTANTWK